VTHAFEYSALDQATRHAPPAVTGDALASAPATSMFDGDREVNLVIRADGSTLVPSYSDAMTHVAEDRLTTLSLPGGAAGEGVVTYAYDPATGHLSGINGPQGVNLGFAYDGALVTTSQFAGAASGSINWSYDGFLRAKQEDLGAGHLYPVTYAYDADDLLSTVAAAGTSALTYSRYDDVKSALLHTVTWGSLVETYETNGFGELAHYSATRGEAVLLDITYTRDGLGRIVSKTEQVGGEATKTTTYGYDPTRLATVTVDGAQTAYSYDDNGNRLRVTDAAGNHDATIDEQDRLVSYDGTTYTYTAWGALASSTANGATTTYTYDALGALREVDLPVTADSSGGAWTYTNDALGRRTVRRAPDGTVTKLLYAGMRPVALLDANDAVVARYVYGRDRLAPELIVTAGTTYRVLCDHLGTPRLLVDAAGNVAEQSDYDAYGIVVARTGRVSEDIFGFAGGIVEDATGFVRFGARDYDPRSGRWTNKDPGGFSGGLNLYAYAVGDPVNVVDSNGRWPMDAGSSWDRWNDFLNQNPEQRPIAAKLGAGALAVGAAEVVALEALPAAAAWLRYALPAAGGWLADRLPSCGGSLSIQFGNNPNQVYHAFRHIDALGLSRGDVQSAIEADLQTAASQIMPGQPFNQVITVAGQRLQYTAYLLADGTINVGRVHGVP
jgi:RHS repeat-associated protein